MRRRENDGINLALAESFILLGRAKLERAVEIRDRPTIKSENDVTREGIAGADLADAHTLAAQILEGADRRVRARHDGERFPLQCQNRAKLPIGASRCERALAAIGAIGKIGLSEAERDRL